MKKIPPQITGNYRKYFKGKWERIFTLRYATTIQNNQRQDGNLWRLLDTLRVNYKKRVSSGRIIFF